MERVETEERRNVGSCRKVSWVRELFRERKRKLREILLIRGKESRACSQATLCLRGAF